LTDGWQQVAEVSPICPAEEPVSRPRELQDGYVPARPRDAGHLRESAIRVGHVSQPERDGYDLKVVVRKRQLLRVGLDDGDSRMRAAASRLGHGPLQHLTRKIRPDDRHAAATGPVVLEGQVAGARADVEERPGGYRHHPSDAPPPRLINVEAEE